jgi:ribonucleotide monophosphatase NagD (HAD superfamily)
MFNEIKNHLQFNPSKTLLIGDRLETDITMGNSFGIDTALVHTGVKFFPNGTENIIPTYQLNSVFDLLNHKS